MGIEKEWERLMDNPDNVIMSDDLIARVHPYNLESELGAEVQLNPQCKFIFEDYEVSGRLYAYTNSEDPPGSLSYTIISTSLSGCHILSNSPLKSFTVTVGKDVIIDNNFTDASIPVKINAHWEPDQGTIITLIFNPNDVLDSSQ